MYSTSAHLALHSTKIPGNSRSPSCWTYGAIPMHFPSPDSSLKRITRSDKGYYLIRQRNNTYCAEKIACLCFANMIFNTLYNLNNVLPYKLTWSRWKCNVQYVFCTSNIFTKLKLIYTYFLELHTLPFKSFLLLTLRH